MPIRFAMLIASACVATAGSVQASDPPLHESIDSSIEAACAQQGGALAESASDAEFLRRVYLDLTGIIPPADKTRAFLACSDDDKRSRLIDQLLDSAEYSLHMSRVFDVMLIERRIATIKSYDVSKEHWRAYLADSFARNKPWHHLVREILSSDGTDPITGPAAKFFLVRDTEPHPVTRDVGRLFLGVDLQCAQCHDDPRYEDYKQADYFGIYAFVNRVQHFRDEEAKRSLIQEKAAGDVQFTSAFTGMQDHTNPRLPGGQMLADPAVEEGQAYDVAPAKGVRAVPKYSRRRRLAEQLPRPETDGFSQNIANRLWSHMMGRGLVHPTDLSHAKNPASHPALLALLVRSLEATDYDIKRFLRDLALSRTYQRSTRSVNQATSKQAFETALLRALSPEQLGWSVLQASGYLQQKLHKAAPELTEGTLASDDSWKTAVYLEHVSVANEFVSVFQGLPGQADGSFQPSVDQTLFLLNGQRITGLLDAGQGTLLDQLAQLQTREAIAEQVFISVLSRYPSDEERVYIESQLAGIQVGSRRTDMLRQIVWGLLLSAEFRLNH